MMELLPSPDHVVALKISETMTSADFDKIIDAVETALGRHERIGALVDLRDFKDATLEAALKDTRYELGKLFQLKRFPRDVVVSDRQWVHSLARIASPLVPFIEIRAFHGHEFDAAMAWVANIGAKSGGVPS
jgi:hypothetical protein